MAVGMGRSANQLHVYSEEGGGIKAMGRGRGWSLSQFGCSGSAGTQGRAPAQQVEPVGGPLAAGNSRAPSCQGAQKVGGGRGVTSK